MIDYADVEQKPPGTYAIVERGQMRIEPKRMTPSLTEQFQPPSVIDVSAVFQPQPTAIEKSTPLDRAMAVVAKSIVPSLLFAFLASGLYVAGLSGVIAVLLFAGGTGIWYVWLSRSSDDYSAGGVERLRITTAGKIEQARMKHERALRTTALKAAIRSINNDQNKHRR